MGFAHEAPCPSDLNAQLQHANEVRQKPARRERDIEQRTFLFAVRILKMVRALPRDIAGQIVTRQLGRCGTSIGANVEEAQGAQSRVDFARKMNIAMSESRETSYWLRLSGAAGLVPQGRLKAITQEAGELVSILTTIVKRTRQKKTTDNRRN